MSGLFVDVPETCSSSKANNPTVRSFVTYGTPLLSMT